MSRSKPAKAQASEGALSREQILDAAEEVFRRFGPAKTTVVDVARVLGMSHGSVYRHFESKLALRNAVVEIWLNRYAESLAEIVDSTGTATARLRLWLETLRELKNKKYRQESEMFATYHDIVRESAPAVDNYREQLTRQIESIILSGIESGEFRACNAHTKARAILDATVRFHHPWHAIDWERTDIDEAFQGVWELIVGDISSTA